VRALIEGSTVTVACLRQAVAGGIKLAILQKREIHRLDRVAVDVDALGVILTYVCHGG
jgi:hypothetical protein